VNLLIGMLENPPLESEKFKRNEYDRREEYMPTLDEIEAGAAIIQSEWDEDTELSRRTGKNFSRVSYQVPRFKRNVRR